MRKQRGWKDSKNSSSLERFIIMCKVSGGQTGTRTAPMKNHHDGTTVYFTDKDVAQTTADYYNERMKQMNRTSNQAQFLYWVEPEGERQ
jgi:hypothetical protein